jgi:hypothetical protein
MDHHLVNAHSITSIPPWLETPSLSPITPPIDTRLQELPFEKLSWANFEWLCLRLARCEAQGVDLIAGELRPVAHALLDALSQPGWIEA